MSVVGVSSYILVTTKGRTYVPFSRGSGFLIKFANHGFYDHHVVTAAHVIRPHKYGHMYGSPREFGRIGDRHVSCKLHRFAHSGERFATLPLEFRQHTKVNTDISALRIEREQALHSQMMADGLPPITPFEVDTGAVGIDEPVIIRGLNQTSEESVDDSVTMAPVDVLCHCRAKYVADHFGTVLLADANQPVTSGMSGAPVIRASNGKLVGVLVASVQREPKGKEDPQPPEAEEPTDVPEIALQQAQWRKKNLVPPTVDISDNDPLLNQTKGDGAAFLPVGEFLNWLRRTETM